MKEEKIVITMDEIMAHRGLTREEDMGCNPQQYKEYIEEISKAERTNLQVIDALCAALDELHPNYNVYQIKVVR